MHKDAGLYMIMRMCRCMCMCMRTEHRDRGLRAVFMCMCMRMTMCMCMRTEHRDRRKRAVARELEAGVLHLLGILEDDVAVEGAPSLQPDPCRPSPAALAL